MNSNKRVDKLTKSFSKIDTSDFPDVYSFDKLLDQCLWVLWVVKDKLKIDSLNAREIKTILTDALEIDADEISIVRAMARAGNKVHPEKVGNIVFYKIMRAGKNYLSPVVGRGIKFHYIAPGMPYSGKKLLIDKILSSLKGEIKISDPYLGERTLDILRKISHKKIKVLTRLNNLREERRKPLLRDIKDFLKEFKNIEIKDYPGEELHDRYVISDDFLCIIGHGLKDLGSKETFVIALKNEICKDIKEILESRFNQRWKGASSL